MKKHVAAVSLKALVIFSASTLVLAAGSISPAAANTLSVSGATLNADVSSCLAAGCPGADGGIEAETGTGTVTSFTEGAQTFDPLGSSTLLVTSLAFDPPNSVTTTTNNPFNYTVGGGGNAANVTAGGLPAPYLSVSMNAPAGVGFGPHGGASGVLTYYFEVVNAANPDLTGTASIKVNAIGAVSGSGTGDVATSGYSVNAEALLEIVGETTVIPADKAQASFSCANGGCVNTNSTSGAGSITSVNDSSETGGFNESGTYQVDLGYAYTVILTDSVNCGASSGGGTASCSASIDPTITVPDGDELILSADFGNSAPTNAPEPATLALMSTALAGIGVVRRRKHRQ